MFPEMLDEDCQTTLSQHPVSAELSEDRHRPAIARSSTDDTMQNATTRRANARPRLTFIRLTSLDRLLIHYGEVAAYDDYSTKMVQAEQAVEACTDIQGAVETHYKAAAEGANTISRPLQSTTGKFRSFVAEAGFCFTIAMTQLLSELYISGFALVLAGLLKDMHSEDSTTAGSFWAAAVLSLVISATLLAWARLADMHGGYLPLMFGLLWLTIWSIIPGLCASLLVLNVARAMQGFAIAALTPSVFVLLGHAYDDNSRRRNIVFGIYGACAPLGFYIGFVVGGLLPPERSNWFFIIAGVLSFLTMVAAYLSVPHDTTNRRDMELKMDWSGAFCIVSGLMLVDYALAAEPRQAQIQQTTTAFGTPVVLCPLLVGIVTLGIAVWVEGWYASCPLLSFDFFRPRGIKSLCVTCLFSYGSFGVWLYKTSGFFSLPAVSGQSITVHGEQLVLWYTPLAIAGVVSSLVGGAASQWLSTKILICLAALAYVGASVVFVVTPLPLSFCSMVLPSMICASLGTDLTFTISNIFLTASQPQKYQGMAGAVSSSLFNLGISFALPISEIVFASQSSLQQAEVTAAENANITAYRHTFLYATVSAAFGLLICIFCFRSNAKSTITADKEQDSSSSLFGELSQA